MELQIPKKAPQTDYSVVTKMMTIYAAKKTHFKLTSEGLTPVGFTEE